MSRLLPADVARVEKFFDNHRNVPNLHVTVSIDTIRAMERVFIALASLPPVQQKGNTQ